MSQKVLIGHGSGGRLSHSLLTSLIGPAFGIEEFLDAAVMDLDIHRIAFTTDSYVVSPIFFPGGDIGSLAVHGTVNDLSVMGAEPLVISLSLILEEGFLMDSLQRIINSVKDAAQRSNVKVVTGDTKVVEKGKGDGIFINTSGIGLVRADISLSPKNIKPGDRIVVSSFIAEHGLAVMAERNGLDFNPPLISDSRPLHRPILGAVERFGRKIRVMRDPTRGGLATVLKEISEASGLCIEIEEDAIPLRPQVLGACDILGLDPLYVASEGVFVAIVAEDIAEELVSFLRGFHECEGATIIGQVKTTPSSMVLLKTKMGGTRIVDMLTGEQLPRIC